MEYFIELRFEDPGYNALVHFVATYAVRNEDEARKFLDELLAAFRRKEVLIISHSSYRIDHDPILRERTYEFSKFFQSIAKASVKIEQFRLDDPDQTESLADNITRKFFSGESSTAEIGRQYNIPVRVLDKKSRNPIAGELYYFSIEHLIPRED